MSDIRTIVSRRGVHVGDGAYCERAHEPVSMLEEVLRSWLAWLPWPARDGSRSFLASAQGHESSLRLMDDALLKTELRQAVIAMRFCGFEDEPLARAFAVIREGSRRVLGLRHHDVQLLASRALLRGRIAEMSTGEGKTLAATLAVCTAAMSGAAVHVVTVNDYLAERDAHSNELLYGFFGLSLGIVLEGMEPQDRRQQYAKDVVYVSNKELTFDYLKDRIAMGDLSAAQLRIRQLGHGPQEMPGLLRGLHVAIVDEADSVLIDEARTPLIISETLPNDLETQVYHQAIDIARQLQSPEHYQIGKDRDIWLTAHAEQMLPVWTQGLPGVWQSVLWRKDLLQKALSALYLFERDQHYIVADGKVQIVDEFTGRVMPDRTWESGLHQMIETKEGCEITGQRKTLSQITYQRFFSKYLMLGGMTGTASEVEPEFRRVYDLSVTRIPTHKPVRRQRWPDSVFQTAEERWQAVACQAQKVARQGRAVLVGTRSVEASEILSQQLTRAGVEHAVLNARQDEDEAQSVAQAGKSGRITVATNMAGRGTDIKLDTDVETSGGLHVILTEFHESARVDRQLFGRSARQGNPGTVQAMVSLDDELFVRYLPSWSVWMQARCLGPGAWRQRLLGWLVKYAQMRAESMNRQVRLDAVRRDRQWLQALGFVGQGGK